MSKFSDVFSEVVPFYEHDGGGFMGYAISRESFTKKEFFEIIKEEYGEDITIDEIAEEHVRFAIWQTDDGPVHNWSNCKPGKGSKPIWWWER